MKHFAVALIVLSAISLIALPMHSIAQQDKTAERNARRLQLQLQNLQQQVQDALTAKEKSDAEKSAAQKQLAAQADEIPRAQGALRKADAGLKAAEHAQSELSARVAALEKELADQKRAADEALATGERAAAQSTKTRDAQLAEMQSRRDEQAKLAGDCTDRNQRLVSLGSQLLDRYRKKGVAEAMKQQDPLLGFTDVEMFNLVQDYRDKLDAERVRPPSPTGTAPPP